MNGPKKVSLEKGCTLAEAISANGPTESCDDCRGRRRPEELGRIEIGRFIFRLCPRCLDRVGQTCARELHRVELKPKTVRR
jgi:hypothetical protein